ncbi:response regulator [Alkalimonas collagenimarina]|uniref:Response regulator n=1 Tax=Alkalimonas collagenimarina TaxID=400390 RepID=A0ABT9H0C5_9GAMM|nr:response regulator [Alkalimonas collagenimarina]MDP4536741.1 response regulator [Alkalimonas collagenimarina]
MESKTLENLRVLIVDDQRSFQLMFKGILYSMGATNVAFAPTGEQALAKCINMDYDVLFVDYHLGTGKNGKQLLEDLREKKLLKPSSIFMIVTGENTVPMVMSAVELEPDDYLIKPFSQRVLRSRIQKIQHKKVKLNALYQALYDEQGDTIIELCQQEISTEGRYQQFCKRVLAETFIKHRKLDAAQQVLSQNLEQHRSGWALVLQAQIYFDQGEFQRCLELCEEALESNRYFAEAFDLKAKAYMAMAQPDEALQCILNASEIAPHSIKRQYLMMEIARKVHDMPRQVQASKQLYEITRRSLKQDVIHLQNYIRTVIEAAMESEEPQQKNRYQQETMIALQRARLDESMIKDIDFDLFEVLCQARLESLSGQQFQAKRTFATVADLLHGQEHSLADAVLLLNQIGEYEEADSLKQKISKETLDNPVLDAIIQRQTDITVSRKEYFAQYNKEGIRLYKAGLFSEAAKQFEQALELAPMNTGAALNYIQSLLQLLSQPQHFKVGDAFERCRKAFRVVDNMPLPEHHRVRYQELLSRYEKIRTERRR